MKPTLDPYAPCSCGSGKKYKFCCLPREREEARRAAEDSEPRRFGQAASDNVVFIDSYEGERLNDKGIALLSHGDFAGAAKCFRAAIRAAPPVPAGHNNLALCAFARGDLDEAIRIQTDATEKLPVENPYGLAQLSHFYLVAGKEEAAVAVLNRATAQAAGSTYFVTQVCQSLARFGRHRQILDTVDDFAGAPEVSAQWYAGVAAANLGEFETALAHLRAVSNGRTPLGARAQELIRRIEGGAGPGTLEGDWPYFLPAEVVPPLLVERVTRNPESMQGLLDSRALAEMAVAMLNEDNGTETAPVELLGGVKHPRAVEILRKLAEGTFGSDQVRVAAVHHLVRRGVWSEEEPHTVWLQGNWRQVKTGGYAITPSSPASAAQVPAALLPRYRQAVELGNRQHWRKAEKVWRELVAEAPDHPPFHYNLGTSLLQQNQVREAEICLRRAMEIEPDYLFAPATLAVLCSEAGRLEEARRILDDTVVPTPVHPDALAMYFAAQIQVALAEQKPQVAVSWLKTAKVATPDGPGIQVLAERLKVVEFLNAGLELHDSEQREKEARLRQRVLARDASLEECFATYTKSDLAGILRALGLAVSAKLRREEMLAAICSALRRPETCRRVVRSLGDRDRAALRDLVAAGGRQNHPDFVRKHGSDAGQLNAWGVAPPQTVMGRLKCRGLLVEATVDRAESVFIPAQVPVDPAWLQEIQTADQR